MRLFFVTPILVVAWTRYFQEESTTILTWIWEWAIRKTVFVSYDCRKKVPQTGDSEPQKYIVSQFWKLEVWDRQGHAPSEVRKGTLPCLTLASGGLLVSLVCLGLKPQPFNLCLCYHSSFPSVSLSSHDISFLCGHQLYWVGTHPNNLILTWLYL